MYEKPKLTRYGNFRDLTRFGFGDDGDAVVIGWLNIDIDACWIGCEDRS